MIFVDFTKGTITQREPRESLRPVADRVIREIQENGFAVYGKHTFTAHCGKSGNVLACEIIPSGTPGIRQYAGLEHIYNDILYGIYET